MITILTWYFVGVLVALVMFYVSNKAPSVPMSLSEAGMLSTLSWITVIILLVISTIAYVLEKIRSCSLLTQFYSKLDEWFKGE